MKIIFKSVVSVFLCVSVFAQAAPVLSGHKTISLIGQNASTLKIGEIVFKEEGGRIQYSIDLNATEFTNEFLSMRPFKCMRFDNKKLCHLPYPYQKKGYITSDDFVDLEYDLLFLHKTAQEYGINAWNGLYYDLKINNDKLEGTLKEVDLNVLSAPPKKGNLRPVTDDMLHEADAERHMFYRLLIQ